MVWVLFVLFLCFFLFFVVGWLLVRIVVGCVDVWLSRCCVVWWVWVLCWMVVVVVVFVLSSWVSCVLSVIFVICIRVFFVILVFWLIVRLVCVLLKMVFFVFLVVWCIVVESFFRVVVSISVFVWMGWWVVCFCVVWMFVCLVLIVFFWGGLSCLGNVVRSGCVMSLRIKLWLGLFLWFIDWKICLV